MLFISNVVYSIVTNAGGSIDFSKPNPSSNPTIGAYRANAACAQFSKIVAAQIYGQHRVYGYCYGGSGCAYRTVGRNEITVGVWDCGVHNELGAPMAIQKVFTVRMHARM